MVHIRVLSVRAVCKLRKPRTRVAWQLCGLEKRAERERKRDGRIEVATLFGCKTLRRFLFCFYLTLRCVHNATTLAYGQPATRSLCRVCITKKNFERATPRSALYRVIHGASSDPPRRARKFPSSCVFPRRDEFQFFFFTGKYIIIKWGIALSSERVAGGFSRITTVAYTYMFTSALSRARFRLAKDEC